MYRVEQKAKMDDEMFPFLPWIENFFTTFNATIVFSTPFSELQSLKCIFLSKRLRETRTGGQREPGGGIHATSWRDICPAEYIGLSALTDNALPMPNSSSLPNTT